MIDTQHPELKAALNLIAARLETRREEENIPGLSAGVVLDQDLIWQTGLGYANLETQTPAGADTIYRMASISKLFNATLLMILRDEGRLQLDDPIEKYLPAFRIRSPFSDARPATFRQIVAHAAGLPREGFHSGWTTMKMPSIEEVLENLSLSEMALPSMTEPKYSNLGIAVLGHTLSVIAGRRFEDCIHDYILQPLGMTSSGYDPEKIDEQRRAVGYYPDADGRYQIAPYVDRGAFRPGGGLYSTINDLARFAALQFRVGPAGGAQILSSSTLREMHSPVSISPDFQTIFGLGWIIRPIAGHKTVGHSGGLPGFSTNMTLVPALRLGAIVFTNQSTLPDTITQSMLELLIPIVERAAERSRPKPTPEQLEQWHIYTGIYGRLGSQIKIAVMDGQLRIHDPRLVNQPDVTLIYHDAHRFRMDGGTVSQELAVFEVDSAGNVLRVSLGPYPYDRVADL